MTKTLLAGFLLVMSSMAHADVLTEWNLTGVSGDDSFVEASNFSGSVSGISLTRGAGLSGSVATNAFNSNGWDDLAVDDYFSFGFNIASGFEVDLADLVIGLRSSNFGPRDLGLFYSGDSFASSVFNITQSGNSFNNHTIDLTSLQDLTGNVEFRIRAVGPASASGGVMSSAGTFRIVENGVNVQFNGTVAAVAAVPEPETYAMFLVGLGLLGFAARRRSA